MVSPCTPTPTTRYEDARDPLARLSPPLPLSALLLVVNNGSVDASRPLGWLARYRAPPMLRLLVRACFVAAFYVLTGLAMLGAVPFLLHAIGIDMRPAGRRFR